LLQMVNGPHGGRRRLVRGFWRHRRPRVYAMPRARSPGYPAAVTSDPLLDPVPPVRDVVPSQGLRRNAAFMRVWSAATISVFGSFVTRIALPFVAILVLGAGPFDVAVLRSLELVAALIVGFVAGAWVDRLRRRPIMVWADIGRAALLGTIPLAAIGGWLTLAQVLVVAALAAVLTTFFDIADRAYLPTIVPRSDLVQANGALAATSSAVEFIAFGVAGFLVAMVTAPIAIAVDAASFVVSAALLGSIRRPEPPPPPADAREPVLAEIREGLRLVVADPVLRGLAGGSMGLAAMWGIFGATWLLFVTEDLRLDPAVIGVIAALGGFGSLLGALLAERAAARFGIGRVVVASMLAAALGNLLIPLSPTGLPLIAVACLVGQQLIGDTAVTVFDVTEVSVRQARVDDRLLGRVNATVRVAMVLAQLAATLAGGLVAEAIGLRAAAFLAPLGALAGAWALYASPVRGLLRPGDR
jgi:MFS family permease